MRKFEGCLQRSTTLTSFACDMANTMCGRNNSIVNRSRIDIPHILYCKEVYMQEVCTEDLEIYTTILSTVPKDSLKKFQTFSNTKTHKKFYPSKTRWYSLEAVVNRILEQYNSVVLIFTDAVENNHLISAENILHGLLDPLIIFFLELSLFSLLFFIELF